MAGRYHFFKNIEHRMKKCWAFWKLLSSSSAKGLFYEVHFKNEPKGVPRRSMLMLQRKGNLEWIKDLLPSVKWKYILFQLPLKENQAQQISF